MMADYQTLIVQKDARGVVQVTLNRPDQHNALSALMIVELTELAGRLTPEGGVRVVVLGGAGRTFCAGGDLNWMRDQILADRSARMTAARHLALMLQAWNELPVPVIGRLHGGAYGGGVGLACICDIAVGTSDLRLGLTETRLGLIPATISPYVVARMGEGAARRIMMSARSLSGEEALHLGLLGSCCAPADLDTAVEAEVAPFLHVAPRAVALTKALVRALGPRIDDNIIETTICRLADAWESDEAAHGIAAFLAKEPPRWA